MLFSLAESFGLADTGTAAFGSGGILLAVRNCHKNAVSNRGVPRMYTKSRRLEKCTISSGETNRNNCVIIYIPL